MTRLRAGVAHTLAEAMSDGHCGLPADDLLPMAAELLDAPEDLVRTALDEELASGHVVTDEVGGTRCVFLAGLHRAERGIAERLARIAAGSLPWPEIDAGKALPWIERRTGLSLAASQSTAIRLALASKVLVITGGPGVGKTTIVNAILRILAAKGAGLVLCAPTGRAARRMTETSGFEARTIHRLLEVDPASGEFRRDADHPLECDLLVVDEASMVDVPLMQRAAEGGSRPRRAADRRRYRPASLGRTGTGAGRHHRRAGGPGGTPERSVPPGRYEPHHRQRAPHQRGGTAGSRPAGRRQRLLLRAGGGTRAGRVQGAGARPRSHSPAIRSRSGGRHPGAVSDEPRRGRRAQPQPGAPGGPESCRRAQGRTLRLDLRAR